jgi:hypothetical protein
MEQRVAVQHLGVQMKYTAGKPVVIQVDDAVFSGQPLTLDQSEPIFEQFKGNGRAIGRAQVEACFRLEPDSVGKLPFAVYQKLWEAASEMNGLTVVTEGEEPATA